MMIYEFVIITVINNYVNEVFYSYIVINSTLFKNLCCDHKIIIYLVLSDI